MVAFNRNQNTLAKFYSEDQTQHANLAAADWQIETIDSGTEVGVYSSLALDSSGYPHIAYIDGGSDPDSVMDDSLSYAYKDSQGWQVQSVPIGLVEDEYAYGETSIAVDPQGYPHISFLLYDMISSSPKTYAWYLAYAYQDGSGWHVDDHIDQVSLILHTSIALYGSCPRIGYFSTDDYHLHYSYKDGAGWHKETADSEGGVGSHVSLKLDDQDNPFLAYARDKTSADDLLMTNKDGSGWHPIEVDTAGDVGKWASLALYKNQYASISYGDDSDPNSIFLKYAYQDAQGWHKQTVDNQASVGKYTSLGLIQNGEAQISYYDDQNQDLKFAMQTLNGWLVESVDTAGQVGKYSSLALDPFGGVHIAYYDETNGALKYAKQTMFGIYLPFVTRE